MRKATSWLTLASLAFSASGLALTLHEHECAEHGEHHERQDCVLHFALQAGCGAQPEAPIVSPTPRLLPYLRLPFHAAQYVPNFQAETIAPRGPPIPPFDVV